MSANVSIAQPPELDPKALLYGTAIDVFELGQVVPATEALVVGSRYMGHVPRPFWPKDGLRISLAEVTAGTIEFAISCGNDGLQVLASPYVWNYTPGVDSFVIPASLFAAWLQGDGDTALLPAGARLTLGIFGIFGVGYGHAFRGWRAEFLGEWRE